MASNLLLHSTALQDGGSGTTLEITPDDARWNLLSFSVRTLADGQRWSGGTGDREHCFVLLNGQCRIAWTGSKEHRLGPRESVFESYPHGAYLPPGLEFEIAAEPRCELAVGAAPCRKKLSPRIILPQDCGFEIRGGGNATRQIVDIMPPEFPADRLLACEVFTPSGNWSSYPPHKHEEDRPPREVKLEEVYYYRFSSRDAYGFQRIYFDDDSLDETLMVRDGDLVLIPRGYHPFVSAYGFDAYYLNFLAGDRRSMAASDDPRYAGLRDEWPIPDPRLPLVPQPRTGRQMLP